MELIKNIINWTSKIVPFSILLEIQKKKLILPLYHMVSDVRVPYVSHLYSYKNIKQFEKDLNYFSKYFNPISLDELMQSIQDDKELPEKSLLLTIDDGYREVYDIIAPLLMKKSIPAVFFINSAFVDNQVMFYRNKASLLIDKLKNSTGSIPINDIQFLLEENHILKEDIQSGILAVPYHQRDILDDIAKILNVDFDQYLKETKPYLTSAQISKLIDDGFSIGSHSIDHPLYKYLSLDEQLRQTKESLNFLKEKFQMPYRAFAFPHNDKGAKNFIRKTHFNGDIEISFGTSGFNRGYCKNNIQRQSMEDTNNSAKAIYKNHFRYQALRQIKNSQLVSQFLPRKKKKYSSEDHLKNKNGKIRIESIPVKNLYEFYKKYEKNRTQDDIAVISKQRAIAHSKNPLADENDIGLIVAYKENQCVGYLGFLLGLVEVRGNYEKVYFPSTWFVSDKVRGQSVGSLLMKEAIALDKALIGTGFNNDSERTWNHLGFEYMNSLHYSQVNFEKRNHWLIRNLDKLILSLKRTTGQLNNENNQFLYNFRKKVVYKRTSKKLESYLEDINYKEVKFIEFDCQEFNKSKNYKFARGIKVINWMLKYLWVESKEGFLEEDKTDFFFSDVRELFYYVAIEFFSKETNNKLGYLVLSISKESNITTLKLLDHDLQCHNSNNILLSVVINYASDAQADRIDITNNIAQHLKSNRILNSSFVRKMERRYLYYMSDMTSKVAIGMKNVDPDYCDGDLPFS